MHQLPGITPRQRHHCDNDGRTQIKPPGWMFLAQNQANPLPKRSGCFDHPDHRKTAVPTCRLPGRDIQQPLDVRCRLATSQSHSHRIAGRFASQTQLASQQPDERMKKENQTRECDQPVPDQIGPTEMEPARAPRQFPIARDEKIASSWAEQSWASISRSRRPGYLGTLQKLRQRRDFQNARKTPHLLNQCAIINRSRANEDLAQSISILK